MPARLDDCRQLRECHLPANFIVSGRHAWWQPFVHGEQVGTAVAISKRHRDRHLAAKRRVSGLELVHFDNLLVWYKASRSVRGTCRCAPSSCQSRSSHRT
jgi:hypothetical protein